MDLKTIKTDKLRKNILKKAAKRGFDVVDWSYFEDAEELMNRLVWTPITPNIKRADPMAFATRSSGLTGVYERYVNPNIDEIDPKVGDAFRMHEDGHCIFTHMSMQKEQREIQIEKILTFWPKIKKHVDLSEALKKAEAKGVSESEVAKKYARMLANQMLNIAMDFEVNSKLFTEEEWVSMKKNTDMAYFTCLAKAPASTEKQLEDADKWLDENEDKPDERFSHPCWPEDYQFPVKLTYGEYIDLMLQNIDQFMNNMANQQGSGDGDGDEGEGEDSEDGNSQGQGGSGDDDGDSQGNKKLSSDDIERMRDEYGDGDNDENQERIDDAENGGDGNTDEENEEQGKSSGGKSGKDGKGKGKGGKDGEAGDAEKEARSRGMAGKRGGHGFSPVGRCDDPTIYVEGADNPKVKDFIMKNIFNKKVINNRVDMMKYYNRKKYGNVMVSTWANENVWRPGDIHMIVDCSGSIDHAAITTFIKVVKEVSKKCGPKSRIIWWDTALEGDTYLRNNKGPRGCGGTDIAGGIEYLRTHHLKNKNDKIIIISDYEDSLYRWEEELSKVKNDCLGICWTYQKVENKYDYLNRCSYADRDGKVLARLMKKLPTMFVNINESRDDE